MKIVSLVKPFIICSISVLVLNVAAQDAPKTRSITSDDFATQRPAKAKVPGKKKAGPKAKSYKYKFVRADKDVVRWGKGAKKTLVKPPAGLPVKLTEVGVTMWKMRPPRAKEIGHLLPVRIDKDTVRMWLAERVGTDAVFNIGDRVRFAVESSDSGYLYILDRETFSDGSFGEPRLIFPSADEDNSIGPGLLFDIPDQRDDEPYFTLVVEKKGDAALTGELITIIIATKPLTIFKPDRKGYVKNSDELLALESAAEVEIFSRTDTEDKIYSTTESEAACGEKTRGLVRETSADKPCGTLSRQLTREEAKPQAIYRTKSPTGQPAVVFVRLVVQTQNGTFL